jgi:small subunit ribosomal protein S20
MPNTVSAKKRLRQNVNRRARNRAIKSLLRKRVREVRDAAAAGNVEGAEASFKVAAKLLDRAGAHRVIHPNVADRTKSRLQAAIKKAKGKA